MPGARSVLGGILFVYRERAQSPGSLGTVGANISRQFPCSKIPASALAAGSVLSQLCLLAPSQSHTHSCSPAISLQHPRLQSQPCDWGTSELCSELPCALGGPSLSGAVSAARWGLHCSFQ